MVSLIKTLFLDIGCASCPKVARVVHPWATLVIHGRVFSIEMVPQTTSNCPKNFDFWTLQEKSFITMKKVVAISPFSLQ